MPRIATLHDKPSGDSNDENDEETRYVGGTDNRGGGSGLAVLPNGEGGGDATGDLLAAARAGGSDGRPVSENAAVITMWKNGEQHLRRLHGTPFLTQPSMTFFRVPSEQRPIQGPQ